MLKDKERKYPLGCRIYQQILFDSAASSAAVQEDEKGKVGESKRPQLCSKVKGVVGGRGQEGGAVVDKRIHHLREKTDSSPLCQRS